MGVPQFLAGVAIGAGIQYLFDPNLGRRRRSLARDQVMHAIAKSSRAMDAALRDMQHRFYGAWAELRSSLKTDEVTDEVLVERVRSRIGRCVAHPAAVDVSARGGRVTLKGLVLHSEIGELLSAVRSVPGVQAVENLLDARHRSENIPGLQGGRRRRGERGEFMQEQWNPTARLVAGSAGCVLMANCLRRRRPGAVLLGTFGFGLLMRAVTNLETGRLLGLGSTPRGIGVQRTVTILAPVEAVFSLIATPTNYPRITRNIREVTKVAEDHYEKTVVAPLGMEIRLDEIVTQTVVNQSISFRSGKASDLKYAGSILFEPTGDGGTRVDVKLSYNPPGGIFGHAVARLGGFDPQVYFDDLLLRAKTFLESGNQPYDAAEKKMPEVHYHDMNMVRP